ncbi:MAG: inner membrane protein [Sodalis sp. Fse]|nr:MAG: inner membrane protein [Sodalis sp. Fse]
MKRFLDFVSLMVFFIIYKLYDIFYASGAMILTSALVIFYTWLRYRSVENVALITFVLVAIFFGSLTLYYHNAAFIKWKVTIIYVLFALVLLLSQFVFGKTLIQKMLDKNLSSCPGMGQFKY